jgi:hypothetical protein
MKTKLIGIYGDDNIVTLYNVTDEFYSKVIAFLGEGVPLQKLYDLCCYGDKKTEAKILFEELESFEDVQYVETIQLY